MWQDELLNWYRNNKRDLPWRKNKDPYSIWISEIMLQQTRVETVKEYYRRFLERLPTIKELAEVSPDELMKLWEGLGYYSRARNLQKAAQIIMLDYQGQFPSRYEEILKLPGIGLYTAGAVASIAFGEKVPAVDGNVNRVVTRFFGIREPIERPSVKRQIFDYAMQAVPADAPGDFNQALMELGATICGAKSFKCECCPISSCCAAARDGDVMELPIHEKKPKPKEMDVGVLLLTYQKKILILKRTEQLLHGLYVFYLTEGISDVKRISTYLEQDEICARKLKKCGEAKHVFTHRIWNMIIYQAELSEEPKAFLRKHPEADFVDTNKLERLPFPTAMEKALGIALKE